MLRKIREKRKGEKGKRGREEESRPWHRSSRRPGRGRSRGRNWRQGHRCVYVCRLTAYPMLEPPLSNPRFCTLRVNTDGGCRHTEIRKRENNITVSIMVTRKC